MITDSYQIRRAVDGDLPQILDLLEVGLSSTASKLRTPVFWQWKHITQPFGPSIIFVAESDGQIVGLRAFMRWAFTSLNGGGEEQHWQAVRAVDTVTHPAYRRLGIFRQLNEVAIGAAKEAGIDFIFNTPNAQSGAGYLKQGWQEVGTLPLFFRINQWKDTVKAGYNFLLKKGRIADVQWQPTNIEPITQGDQDLFHRLANSTVEMNRQLSTQFSPEYFEWRYAKHPYVTYYKLPVDQANHYLVVRPNIRFGVRELVICELPELVNNEMYEDEIARTLKKSGCSYVVIHSSRYHPNQNVLEGIGFRKMPQQFGMTLVVYPLSDKAAEKNLLQLNEWAFSMGTLEVF